MLEWLKAILGDAYTNEIDTKVSGEIGKGFVAKTDFNNVKAELKTAKDTITERDGQLTALKASTGDVDALKQQITDLQADNVKKDQTHAAELAGLKLDAAVEKALGEAHAKNTTAAKALLAVFLKDAKVEEDGTVRGLSDEIKKMAESEDTSFLFASKKAEGDDGGMAGASPAGNGGSGAGAGSGGSGAGTTLAESIQASLFGNKT